MSVLALVILLVLLGVILWIVNKVFPEMDGTLKKIITIVVIIVAVALCLSAFGVWDELRGIKVPHV